MSFKILKLMFVLLTLVSASACAQDSIRFTKTSVYGEIGGAGFFSANIEQLFMLDKSFSIVGRGGLGIYPSKLGSMGGKSSSSGIIPLTASIVYGRKWAVEAGLGVSIGWDDAEDAHGSKGPVKWYNGMLGVRYQNPRNGFFLRFGYTPYIRFPKICQDTNCTSTATGTELLSLMGISLGARIRASKK